MTVACEALRFYELREATLPAQATPLFVKLCCRADEPLTAFRALCPASGTAKRVAEDALLAPERRSYATALALLQPHASRGCFLELLKRLSIRAVDGKRDRAAAVVGLLAAMRGGDHAVGSREYYYATRALLLPGAGEEEEEEVGAGAEEEGDDRHAAFGVRAVQEVLQAALDGGHASTALLNLVLARAVEGCDDLDAAAALDFAQRGAAVVTIGDATRELMARAEAAAAPPAPVEEDEDDGAAEEEDDSSSDSDSGSDSSADDSSESSDDEDGAPAPAST